MRVEVTIDKTRPLPAGAIEALTGELGKRVNRQFPDAVVQYVMPAPTASPCWEAPKPTGI